METSEEYQSIDIEKVIASKSKKGKLSIPRFLINYIKRKLHQDDINQLLYDHRNYQGVEFVTRCLKTLNVSYRIHGKENIDKTKRYVFASNHPLGGLDGMVYISYIGNLFGDVRSFSNDLLMNINPLKGIFIPVNKYGKMNHHNAELYNEAFESNTPIIYFPAGLCSRLINGEITDLEWKKSFVTKSIEYKRDIVPIYFEGRNSMFFYRVAKLRKFLKIKFNIETFFLPDELFKQKNSTFDIYIGKPIPTETITKELSDKEWTLKIRENVYSLKA